jgi:hypothetical protein
VCGPVNRASTLAPAATSALIFAAASGTFPGQSVTTCNSDLDCLLCCSALARGGYHAARVRCAWVSWRVPTQEVPKCDGPCPRSPRRAPGPGNGSVSEAAADYGREHGIAVIDDGSPCMFGPTADPGHKAMRTILTLPGNAAGLTAAGAAAAGAAAARRVTRRACA